MIHMPDIKKPNGESFPYCLPNDYECADKQLDFLVSADNAACVCETPCEVVRLNCLNFVITYLLLGNHN